MAALHLLFQPTSASPSSPGDSQTQLLLSFCFPQTELSLLNGSLENIFSFLWWPAGQPEVETTTTDINIMNTFLI